MDYVTMLMHGWMARLWPERLIMYEGQRKLAGLTHQGLNMGCSCT